MYHDVVAAIHSLLLVRSVVLGEWLARIVTTSTPNPADSTSYTYLLSLICIFKQLVQSYYRLSVKQQSADENPPTVRLAHSECNPHCQPKYWYESRKPTAVHLARHDAAADVRTSLVAPDTFLEFPSAFSATLLHHHTLTAGTILHLLHLRKADIPPLLIVMASNDNLSCMYTDYHLPVEQWRHCDINLFGKKIPCSNLGVRLGPAIDMMCSNFA